MQMKVRSIEMITDGFRAAVDEYLRPYEGYFNYGTMRYSHVDIEHFRPFIEAVNQYRTVAGSTVLSSGCGSAGDLLTFMRYGAARVLGIEVDPGLAHLAQRRFAETEFKHAAEIDLYGGLQLPYKDNSFDIVFSIHVIEHTQEPSRYFLELCRVLRPGGIIFLDVPSRYYRFDQHTMLPYIHWPATKLRNTILKILLSRLLGARLSTEHKYKLSSYFDYHIPSPGHLLNVYRTAQPTYGLELRDAFFHSYDGQRVAFQGYPGKYFWGRIRKLTTFRFVIGKI
jgi:SAM-dependent methyltransferase